jgi:hypothetical protein
MISGCMTFLAERGMLDLLAEMMTVRVEDIGQLLASPLN